MKKEQNYSLVSQNISGININSKKPHKSNHTWNREIYDLERLSIKTRAGKIIKDIKEQLSTLSGPQNLTNGYFSSLIDSSPSTSSKKSLITIKNLKKKKVYSKMSKLLPLRSSLEELETKIKEQKSFQLCDIVPKNNKIEDFEATKSLFEVENVLSESTLSKIKQIELKVNGVRESLSFPVLSKDPENNQNHLKQKRSQHKIRATQINGKKSSVRIRFLHKSETLKFPNNYNLN